MKRFIGLFVFAALLQVFPGCGKKGPLEPPFARKPSPIESFSVFQRGAKVICEWNNPETYVDGRALEEIQEVEIWIREVSSAKDSGVLKPEDFEKEGRLHRVVKEEEFPILLTDLSDQTTGFALTLSVPGDLERVRFWGLALRVRSLSGHASDFSPAAFIGMENCALPPELRDIRLREDGIDIRWAPPPANIDGTRPALVFGYMVYRSEDGQAPRPLTAVPVQDLRHLDRDIRVNQTYRYFVRACSSAGHPCLESEDSGSLVMTARDEFPPDVPSRLAAIAAGNSVSLSWNPLQDDDLAGYRIWRRKQDDKNFLPLAPELILENAYTDNTVEKGERYIYAVSAVDRSGNESRKSTAVLIHIKDGPQ